MPTLTPKQIWIGASFAVLLIVFTAFQTTHLPRLVADGYPATEWPAHGTFVTVPGAETIWLESTPSIAMNPELETLFRDSGGKSLLVFHAGKLKLEHYTSGVDANTQFNSFSMVKSLVGVLLLKAVEDGKIDGLHVPLGAFLPEIKDSSLRDLPLKNVLDMRSGIAFEVSEMKALSGPDEKDLERTMLNPLGPMARLHIDGPEPLLEKLTSDTCAQTTFNYQNINTALLGLVIARAYEQPLHVILGEKIWQPSGAQSAMWRQYPDTSLVSAYCCLYATPRDWILVGRFLMSNGTDDDPLLSTGAWNDFMGMNIQTTQLAKGDYSFQTRHDILDRAGEPLQGRFTYFVGQGGQMLYMMPDEDLIVVRFGDKHQKLHSTLYSSWRSIHP